MRRLIVLLEASDYWNAEFDRILPQLNAAFDRLPEPEQAKTQELEATFNHGDREPFIQWARSVVPDAFQNHPAIEPIVSEPDDKIDAKTIVLGEYVTADERTQFLAACEFWATEVQANAYETGYKPEAEEVLLLFAHFAKSYATVHFGTLFRGTSGMTRRQAAAIVRYHKSKTFDLSESKLSSWTTNPQVAERFASKTGGIVLQYPAHHFKIFVSMNDVWNSMSSAEKKQFDGIHVGSSETEIIVYNPPSLVVTSNNIHRFTPDRSIYDLLKFN